MGAFWYMGLKLIRSLSRSEQVKTLLAGPSPISPMKAEIAISPISNRYEWGVVGRVEIGHVNVN